MQNNKIANFEINLENLENNIAKKISEDVTSNILNNIKNEAILKIEKEVISKFDKNFVIELINNKAEELLEQKIENMLNIEDKNGKTLSDILLKLFAENLLKTTSKTSNNIKTSLENALNNANIERYLPSIPNGQLLLKEVQNVDNEGNIYSVSIYMNHKEVLHIGEGEPEDMTINRNLNDVLNIYNLLKTSYSYGKAGKDLYTQTTTERE